MTWSKIPPTYREWMDAKNYGAWWVKFMLCPEETVEIDDEDHFFPEAWITDVVTLTCSHEKGGNWGRGGEGVKLHADGQIVGKFDLDDEKKIKGLYWQAVKPPDDDVLDERPETA